MVGLPEQWDFRRIKGQRIDFLGQPGQGTVRFTPTAPRIKERNTYAIIFARSREVNLDQEGRFEIDLPVSVGDEDVTPFFQYNVVEDLQGAPTYSYVIEIDISLPTEGPDYPFDIARLSPVGPVPVGTTALTREMADLLYVPVTGGAGPRAPSHWIGTQAQYDALPAKDADRLYLIRET